MHVAISPSEVKAARPVPNPAIQTYHQPRHPAERIDAPTSRLCATSQDELFLPELTVREHLMCQAWVRMDSAMTAERRRAQVERAIVLLGLEARQPPPALPRAMAAAPAP